MKQFLHGAGHQNFMTRKTFADLVEAARPLVSELKAIDVPRLQANGALVIDIREDTERQNDGWYPGSLHLGRGVIERDIHKNIRNLDAELLLYCGGGMRSVLAARTLQDMGFTRVYSIAGGWESLEKIVANSVGL